MPNIKSAKKRMRQNERLRAANRSRRSALRTAIKKIQIAIAEKDIATAQSLMSPTLSIIGKCAQKRIVHRKAAARYSSRLTREVGALKPASEEAAAEA